MRTGIGCSSSKQAKTRSSEFAGVHACNQEYASAREHGLDVRKPYASNDFHATVITRAKASPRLGHRTVEAL
jgi:hypothetical protein